MSEKKVVLTEGAPAAAHVFSQAVHKGGFLQVSGQGPMDPATNEYIGVGDVRAQTRRTLENIQAILAAGDSSFEDVLMFRVADLDVKDLMLADERGIFFTTPHFDGYAAVLMHIRDLARLDREELEDLVAEAWLTRAQKRVAKAWLAEHELTDS